MSNAVRKCTSCGSDKLTDNGGAEKHMGTHGLHYLVEGVLHGNPLKVAMGAGGIAGRLLQPKKFICGNCGHSFKA